MNSDSPPRISPPAILELRWRKVATRLATKVLAIHFDAGADDDHVIDEFVIRQALREVLIDLLSTAFVSTKEVPYPHSRHRMDLTIGPINSPVDFAIELKGARASVEELTSDWKKMLSFASGHRISIMAGIVSASRFERLSAALKAINPDLGREGVAEKVADDFLSLSPETEVVSAGRGKTLVSFVYIWHIKTPSNPLPAVGYHLIPI